MLRYSYLWLFMIFILFSVGPGNNGGDGLVAARHLHHFGYNPTVLYPKPSSKDIYNRLIIQCKNLGIHFLDNLSSSDLQTHKHYDFLVDGIFGFGFKGDIRPPFDHIMKVMKSTTLPIVSIDVPSGWDVENGDVTGNGIKPEMLVSLTAPKLCAKGFQGKYHYLGGRFVPPGIAKEYELEIPKYEAHCQFVKLN